MGKKSVIRQEKWHIQDQNCPFVRVLWKRNLEVILLDFEVFIKIWHCEFQRHIGVLNWKFQVSGEDFRRLKFNINISPNQT